MNRIRLFRGRRDMSSSQDISGYERRLTRAKLLVADALEVAHKSLVADWE